MAVTIKEKRIEFRVSSETKSILEDAAKLANISLSSYILSVSLKQARLDLAKNETILLNNAERNRFIKTILNPPKPNTKLKKILNDIKKDK